MGRPGGRRLQRRALRGGGPGSKWPATLSLQADVGRTRGGGLRGRRHRSGSAAHRGERPPRPRTDAGRRHRYGSGLPRRGDQKGPRSAWALCALGRRPVAVPAAWPTAARGDRGKARRAHTSATPLRLDGGGSEARARPDGGDRQAACLVDGRRHADRAVGPRSALALRVLPAALRPGDQPGDRPDPGSLRDVAAHVAGSSAGAAVRRAAGAAPRAALTRTRYGAAGAPAPAERAEDRGAGVCVRRRG